MKNVFLLLVVVLSLSACKDEENEVKVKITTQATDKTVEYFLAHEEERISTLKTCANNPGDLKDDPVCVNAEAAEIRSMKRGSNTRF